MPRILLQLLRRVLVLVLVLVLASITPAVAQSNSSVVPSQVAVTVSPSQAQFFKFIFPPDYDSNTRPFVNWTTPVSVSTLLRLNLLYNVDSENSVFSLDIIVQENWNDWRLNFNQTLWPYPLSLIRLPIDSIWKPDLFFISAMSCSTLNSQLYLYPGGSVVWTRHQTCVFHNEFDLHNFPFDDQQFELKRLSFSYNIQELNVYFPSNCFWPSPLNDYSSSLWVLTDFNCANATYHFRDGQPEYASPTAMLFVSRTWQNYVLKMILPMFSLVLLSTFSYWVDPKSAPARVAFSVSLILSIVTFNLLVSQGLPKVNYSTLLDWYVWYCFMYVIMAMGEFCLVSSLLTSKNSDPELGLVLDDFCQWVVGPVWLFSNLVFWPIIPPEYVFFRGLIPCLSFMYGLGNAARCRWNYLHGRKGMRAAWFRLWEYAREQRDKWRGRKTIRLDDNVIDNNSDTNKSNIGNSMTANADGDGVTQAQAQAQAQAASYERVSDGRGVIGGGGGEEAEAKMDYDGPSDARGAGAGADADVDADADDEHHDIGVGIGVDDEVNPFMSLELDMQMATFQTVPQATSQSGESSQSSENEQHDT